MWKSKLILLVTPLFTLPSCSALDTMATGEYGRIEIRADAEGMKELSNLLASQAQIAKDAPNLKGASWSLRERQEEVKALRFQFKKKGAQ